MMVDGDFSFKHILKQLDASCFNVQGAYSSMQPMTGHCRYIGYTTLLLENEQHLHRTGKYVLIK
jgi:hypothetical protein